ncbi:3-deoxy-8-phosphooctulonate synthase [Ichthyobacterium seriolicida]|uniref:3-deoxy-8-phosphooctulonate synthase n=1 Tax=Ichthyobacterium seriolicida TaxID=242600 RepID=A0A1J1DZ29_9FLAO|nr:3-deoxy-8-phosphooctulonate synthase [Ichthyobacterium seriolicida]BAV95175.1 2-dehydro-3-deoxyphosphooctonate aldolase [Ichthyobacterium seriolicida]
MIENLNNIKHTDSNNFFIIAGPCLIESEYMAMKIAEGILEITDILKIPTVFKGSFKKANRSRIDSFTGIGDEKALRILKLISDKFQIPTLTDIHTERDAVLASEYVDVLQIPAFLVRQTDLLLSAAKTGKFINLKKGQFMSPESMKYAVDKIEKCGNNNHLVTDRGTMFGYNDLIVDFRGIPSIKKISTAVLDVTHSLQRPNQKDGITGGNPNMIETIARAGIAVGIDGIFLETHHDPATAKSDGSNMLKLEDLKDLLIKLTSIRKAINNF